MFWLGLRTYLGTRRMRRRAFTQLVLPPALLMDRDIWAERLAPLFGHDLADHPPVVMKQLAAMRAYDATPRLHDLAGLPTLVVAARYDRIARPEVVRALASSIAGSRLVEFDDAAHGVTIQCADRINALLHGHFSAVEPR
jgi:pimeloyl-ACP methyl ester carboxylesterase